MSSWVAALCSAVVMVLSVSAAWAERRVALVVGNSQYGDSSLVLSNPRKDAEDVAATLRSLGFEVTLALDATKRDFDLAMTGFTRAAIDAEATDVIQQTNGEQRPELMISLSDEYYLNQSDRPVWERIKDTANPAAFRDFITQFPSSSRVSDAQYRLTLLERGQMAREEAASSRDEVAAMKPEAGAKRQKQPPRLQPATMTQEQVCKKDEDKLVRLRATQVRDEVARFARELGCERLRPQLLRLLESLSPEGEHYGHMAPQPPAADAGPQEPEPETSTQQVAPSLTPEQICERDQERLTRLRASQVPDEVTRFEHELGCERLRPQVMRLRESLGVN